MLDAIVIQRQVGGSLAELFELVAETVRSREQFRRKVRALTGMVRASANVLTALPFVAALLLTLLNPELHAAALDDHGRARDGRGRARDDDLGDDHAAADRDGKGVTMVLLLLAGLSFAGAVFVFADSLTPAGAAPDGIRRDGPPLLGRGRFAAPQSAAIATTDVLEDVGRRFTTASMRRAAAEPDRCGRTRRQGDAGVVRSDAARPPRAGGARR